MSIPAEQFHRDRRVWFLSWLLARGFKELRPTLLAATREPGFERAIQDALITAAERFEGWAATARSLAASEGTP